MRGRPLSDVLRQLTAEKRTSPRPEAQLPGENPLAEYFFNNPGRLIHKWHHYFDIYHRHFARFRGRSPVVVEIGGGHRREGTFLEYGKALIDRLYGWYSRDHTVLTADEFTRATYALHFYDSVLVIEKSPKAPPQTSLTGTPSF